MGVLTTLPSKYFYDARGSQLFEAITQQPEYDLTRTEIALLQRAMPAIRAVVSNESNVIFNGALATMPFVVQGQLKGIAVSGDKRLPGVPNLPTFKELGMPIVEVGSWQGFLASKGTPPAMAARLNAEIKKILAMPEIANKIVELGGEVRTDTPEEFGAWETVYAHFNRWSSDGTLEDVFELLKKRCSRDGRFDHSLWSIDGSVVRAHRCAGGGGKKGTRGNRTTMHSAAPEAVFPQKSMSSAMEKVAR